MKWYTYVLFSKKDRKLYVGCTSNYGDRLKAHNAGKVFSTKNRRPLVGIYLEEHVDKGDAFSRERFLKSLWGSRFKRKILDNYLDGLNQS